MLGEELRKFPRIRDDGTFRVEVLLGTPGGHAAALPGWLAEWHAGNQRWERTWTSGLGVDHEVLLWDQCFSAPPVARPDSETVAVRLLGLETRYARDMWRDWYARMVQAVVEAFPGTTLLSVRDATD